MIIGSPGSNQIFYSILAYMKQLERERLLAAQNIENQKLL